MNHTLIALMRITPGSYLELMYRYGAAYAHHQWGTHPTFMGQVLETSAYWRWWRQNFTLRSDQLVSKYMLTQVGTDSHNVSYAVTWLFAEANTAENIHIYPSNVIMDQILTEISVNHE